MSRIPALMAELERQAVLAAEHEQLMNQMLNEALRDDWLPEHVAVARESVESATELRREAEARLANAHHIVAAASSSTTADPGCPPCPDGQAGQASLLEAEVSGPAPATPSSDRVPGSDPASAALAGQELRPEGVPLRPAPATASLELTAAQRAALLELAETADDPWLSWRALDSLRRRVELRGEKLAAGETCPLAEAGLIEVHRPPVGAALYGITDAGRALAATFRATETSA